MTGFATATAVTLRNDVDDAHSVYDVTLEPTWSIAGKPHGGYLLAILARAATEAAAARGADHPLPIASSAHYVKSPDAGKAEVCVEILRIGRSISQARARLVQGGETRVDATFTLGLLDQDSEPWWTSAVPVEGPSAESSVRTPPFEPTSGLELAVMKHVDLDIDIADLGFALGNPGGAGRLTGRMSFADGQEPDVFALLFAADVLPPVTMDLGAPGWVPTLELTVYVRALPAPGPLTVRHQGRLAQGRLLDEAAEVWDSRGRLVAQATQLAAPRLPSTPPAGA